MEPELGALLFLGIGVAREMREGRFGGDIAEGVFGTLIAMHWVTGIVSLSRSGCFLRGAREMEMQCSTRDKDASTEGARRGFRFGLL